MKRTSNLLANRNQEKKRDFHTLLNINLRLILFDVDYNQMSMSIELKPNRIGYLFEKKTYRTLF